MRRFPLAILLSIVVAVPLGCGGVRAKRMPATHSLIDLMRRPGEARSRDDLESFVLCREGLSEFDGAGGMDFLSKAAGWRTGSTRTRAPSWRWC